MNKDWDAAQTAKHEAAVVAITKQYRDIAVHQTPRLGKQTSNLFRFGASAEGARLNVNTFNNVLWVDRETRTARVGGMTTYEALVDATLAEGLMPLVVPQLKTITLGGAVTGLGIESTSFRDGLPHESVRGLEILTGDGEVVVADKSRHSDLFAAFPNSYGTFGYALSLTIELAPVRRYVRLRHLRFVDPDECAAAIAELSAPGSDVDFLDGVAFGTNELYLTVGNFTDSAPYASSYTGQKIFYKSIREREVDYLTIRDYIWRWDTDWFWCSRVFGAQNPLIRQLWPTQWLRSDVYHKLVGLDRKWGLSRTWDRLRGRRTEAVIQDVEVPVDQLAHFLRTFARDIGITPVWLCPVKTREVWPLYPMKPGSMYVNIGFWSGTPLRPGQSPDHHNRLIEKLVSECGGHKSLYSTVHYPEEEFWERYNGAAYWPVKKKYDPGDRLLNLYEKCVRRVGAKGR